MMNTHCLFQNHSDTQMLPTASDPMHDLLDFYSFPVDPISLYNALENLACDQLLAETDDNGPFPSLVNTDAWQGLSSPWAELEDIGSTSDTIWSPAASPTSLIVDGSSPLTDDGLNTQWLLKHEPVFFLPKPIAPPATPDPINISRQSPFHPKLTGACRSCDNIHCQTKGGSLVTTWRMHEHHGKMLVLCNACFMYMRKHEKFRPRSLCIKPKRPHRLRYIGEQDRVCSHCGITKTPSWRFLKQKMLCNACMQYWKRHHTLKSVVSKHSVAN